MLLFIGSPISLRCDIQVGAAADGKWIDDNGRGQWVAAAQDNILSFCDNLEVQADDYDTICGVCESVTCSDIVLAVWSFFLDVVDAFFRPWICVFVVPLNRSTRLFRGTLETLLTPWLWVQ